MLLSNGASPEPWRPFSQHCRLPGLSPPPPSHPTQTHRSLLLVSVLTGNDLVSRIAHFENYTTGGGPAGVKKTLVTVRAATGQEAQADFKPRRSWTVFASTAILRASSVGSPSRSECSDAGGHPSAAPKSLCLLLAMRCCGSGRWSAAPGPPLAAMFLSSLVFTLYHTIKFVRDLRQHLQVGPACRGVGVWWFGRVGGLRGTACCRARPAWRARGRSRPGRAGGTLCWHAVLTHVRPLSSCRPRRGATGARCCASAGTRCSGRVSREGGRPLTPLAVCTTGLKCGSLSSPQDCGGSHSCLPSTPKLRQCYPATEMVLLLASGPLCPPQPLCCGTPPRRWPQSPTTQAPPAPSCACLARAWRWCRRCRLGT